MKLLKIASVVGFLFAVSLSANSQETSGLIGRVFDRNGSVIVGARVLVLGKPDARYELTTNGEGSYRIGLPPGFYSIEVSANGLSNFAVECYQIPLGNPVTLDVTLTVRGELSCNPQRKLIRCGKRHRSRTRRKAEILM